MNSKKSKLKISPDFRTILEDLCGSLLVFYADKIPQWDQEQIEELKKFPPTHQEIEYFPLQLDVTYIILKNYLFHPATWKFSGQKLINVIHNPVFFTYDFLIQDPLVYPGVSKDPAPERFARHEEAVKGFCSLVYLNQKYFERLKNEVYGQKVIQNDFTNLARMIAFSEKNRELTRKVGDESLSVIEESIAQFIAKRVNMADSLKDYIPPQIDNKPLLDLYLKVADLLEASKNIPFIMRDAIKGEFRQLGENARRLLNAHRKTIGRIREYPFSDFIDNDGKMKSSLKEALRQPGLENDSDFASDRIEEFREQLNERQVEVLNLYLKAFRDSDKTNQEEIARSIGITRKTLYTELQRIRKLYDEMYFKK